MASNLILEIDFSKSLSLQNDVSAEWAKDIVSLAEDWISGKEFFAINTSGSTGVPKQIELSRKDIENNAMRTINFFNIGNSSVLLNSLPVNHVGGMMMIIRAAMAQAKLICVKPSSNPLNDAISFSGKVSFASFTPMQIFEIISRADSNKVFSEIENVIIGGAAVRDDLREKLSAYPNTIFETFGMTETISHIALRAIAPVKSDSFHVLKGVEIASDAEDRLIINVEGKAPIITNDIVSIVAKDKFIWKGRADQVINTGGKKVFITDIEERLKPFIDFPFFITKTNDKKLGEKVAFVTDREAAIEQLKSIFSQQLDSYQKPRSFVQIQKINQSSLGKIQRYFSDEEMVKMTELNYN